MDSKNKCDLTTSKTSSKKKISGQGIPGNIHKEKIRNVKRARSCKESEKTVDEDQIDFSRLSVDIWRKKRSLKFITEKFPIPKTFFREKAWKIDELQVLKSRLNATKCLIDTCNLESWHKHTKRLNTAGEVIPAVRNNYNPEFCSQAWCKFYECLNNFSIIPQELINRSQQEGPDQELSLCTVHLCEAPGAFISATNNFIQSNHPQMKWDWLATTLNPHHEGNDVGSMINEDKLILNSLQNWTFLKDNTGNIMNETNIDSLIQAVQKKFKNSRGQSIPVSLVTADGSIDCQSNPMEQEAMVAQLHLSEIVAALLVLSIGGSFILKMFTFLECQAISHLYLLCSLFEEVHLFKPATSKEGNSEVYLICLRYIGKDRFLFPLAELKKSLDSGHKLTRTHSLLPKSIVQRAPFLDRLLLAAKLFAGYQMGIIKRNMHLYLSNDDPSMYFHYDLIRAEVAQEWIRKFKIVELRAERRLFGENVNRRFMPHVDKRTETGTFLDKLKRNTADVWQKIRLIRTELQFFKTCGRIRYNKSEIWGSKDAVAFASGKPYTNILSSRFCSGKLLLERQELRDAIKPYAKVLTNMPKTLPTGDCCSQAFLIKELSKVYPDVVNKSKEDGWMLHILCSHEKFVDFFSSNDIDVTRVRLKKVLRKVSIMTIGHSLFLCEFPLLTRLHIGLMYVLSFVFEKVLVCLNTQRTLRGVLLQNYNGVSMEDLEWGKLLAQELMKLDDKKESVVLQIVPTEILANLGNYNHIFEYNLYNTSAHLEEILDQTEKMLPKDGHINLDSVT